MEIETLGELYYACLENRIALLKGFGQKTQENLISIIEFKFQNKNKWLWARLEPIALSILNNLKTSFIGIEIDFTGEFRSLNQTVESLDFVALIEQNRLIEYLEQKEFNIDTYEKNVIVYTSPLGIRGKFYLVENQSDFILKRFVVDSHKRPIPQVNLKLATPSKPSNRKTTYMIKFNCHLSRQF